MNWLTSPKVVALPLVEHWMRWCWFRWRCWIPAFVVLLQRWERMQAVFFWALSDSYTIACNVPFSCSCGKTRSLLDIYCFCRSGLTNHNGRICNHSLAFLPSLALSSPKYKDWISNYWSNYASLYEVEVFYFLLHILLLYRFLIYLASNDSNYFCQLVLTKCEICDGVRF